MTQSVGTGGGGAGQRAQWPAANAPLAPSSFETRPAAGRVSKDEGTRGAQPLNPRKHPTKEVGAPARQVTGTSVYPLLRMQKSRSRLSSKNVSLWRLNQNGSL
jgi:hypothetical protein